MSFSCPEKITFTIHWYLKYYPCHNEFHNIEVKTLQNVTEVGGLCACLDVIGIYCGDATLPQEMYEYTPLSRGKSLDPNPLGQGEYIEHKHSHLTCSSTLLAFPMLRVGACLAFVCLARSNTGHVVPLIIS